MNALKDAIQSFLNLGLDRDQGISIFCSKLQREASEIIHSEDPEDSYELFKKIDDKKFECKVPLILYADPFSNLSADEDGVFDYQAAIFNEPTYLTGPGTISSSIRIERDYSALKNFLSFEEKLFDLANLNEEAQKEMLDFLKAKERESPEAVQTMQNRIHLSSNNGVILSSLIRTIREIKTSIQRFESLYSNSSAASYTEAEYKKRDDGPIIRIKYVLGPKDDQVHQRNSGRGYGSGHFTFKDSFYVEKEEYFKYVKNPEYLNSISSKEDFLKLIGYETKEELFSDFDYLHKCKYLESGDNTFLSGCLKKWDLERSGLSHEKSNLLFPYGISSGIKDLVSQAKSCKKVFVGDRIALIDNKGPLDYRKEFQAESDAFHAALFLSEELSLANASFGSRKEHERPDFVIIKESPEIVESGKELFQSISSIIKSSFKKSAEKIISRFSKYKGICGSINLDNFFENIETELEKKEHDGFPVNWLNSEVRMLVETPPILKHFSSNSNSKLASSLPYAFCYMIKIASYIDEIIRSNELERLAMLILSLDSNETGRYSSSDTISYNRGKIIKDLREERLLPALKDGSQEFDGVELFKISVLNFIENFKATELENFSKYIEDCFDMEKREDRVMEFFSIIVNPKILLGIGKDYLRTAPATNKDPSSEDLLSFVDLEYESLFKKDSSMLPDNFSEGQLMYHNSEFLKKSEGILPAIKAKYKESRNSQISGDGFRAVLSSFNKDQKTWPLGIIVNEKNADILRNFLVLDKSDMIDSEEDLEYLKSKESDSELYLMLRRIESKFTLPVSIAAYENRLDAGEDVDNSTIDISFETLKFSISKQDLYNLIVEKGLEVDGPVKGRNRFPILEEENFLSVEAEKVLNGLVGYGVADRFFEDSKYRVSSISRISRIQGSSMCLQYCEEEIKEFCKSQSEKFRNSYESIVREIVTAEEKFLSSESAKSVYSYIKDQKIAEFAAKIMDAFASRFGKHFSMSSVTESISAKIISLYSVFFENPVMFAMTFANKGFSYENTNNFINSVNSIIEIRKNNSDIFFSSQIDVGYQIFCLNLIYNNEDTITKRVVSCRDAQAIFHNYADREQVEFSQFGGANMYLKNKDSIIEKLKSVKLPRKQTGSIDTNFEENILDVYSKNIKFLQSNDFTSICNKAAPVRLAKSFLKLYTIITSDKFNGLQGRLDNQRFFARGEKIFSNLDKIIYQIAYLYSQGDLTKASLKGYLFSRLEESEFESIASYIENNVQEEFGKEKDSVIKNISSKVNKKILLNLEELFKELNPEDLPILQVSDKIMNCVRSIDLISSLIEENFSGERMALRSIAEKKNPKMLDLNQDFFSGGRVYKFRALSDGSALFFSIGTITNCCQILGGYGNNAVVDSFTNSEAGVVILYVDDTEESNILAQSYFHIVNDEYFIFDNIEINYSACSRISEDYQEFIPYLYHRLSKILVDKYGYKDSLLGHKYTKVSVSNFEHQSLKSDPRTFKEYYSDFQIENHSNLSKYSNDNGYDSTNLTLSKENKDLEETGEVEGIEESEAQNFIFNLGKITDMAISYYQNDAQKESITKIISELRDKKSDRCKKLKAFCKKTGLNFQKIKSYKLNVLSKRLSDIKAMESANIEVRKKIDKVKEYVEESINHEVSIDSLFKAMTQIDNIEWDLSDLEDAIKGKYSEIDRALNEEDHYDEERAARSIRQNYEEISKLISKEYHDKKVSILLKYLIFNKKESIDKHKESIDQKLDPVKNYLKNFYSQIDIKKLQDIYSDLDQYEIRDGVVDQIGITNYNIFGVNQLGSARNLHDIFKHRSGDHENPISSTIISLKIPNFQNLTFGEIRESSLDPEEIISGAVKLASFDFRDYSLSKSLSRKYILTSVVQAVIFAALKKYIYLTEASDDTPVNYRGRVEFANTDGAYSLENMVVSLLLKGSEDIDNLDKIEELNKFLEKHDKNKVEEEFKLAKSFQDKIIKLSKWLYYNGFEKEFYELSKLNK